MEFWDVYDSQGNVTGKIKTRADEFLEDEYHLGASLWIVNHKGDLLIQKRALTKRIGPGKWGITGGAVRAGERSADGCVREVWEELGLQLKTQDIELLSRSFGKNIIFDDYVIVLDFTLTDAVLQAEEVSEIRWASVGEIRELFYKGKFMFDDISEMDGVVEYIDEHIR